MVGRSSTIFIWRRGPGLARIRMKEIISVRQGLFSKAALSLYWCMGGSSPVDTYLNLRAQGQHSTTTTLSRTTITAARQLTARHCLLDLRLPTEQGPSRGSS